MVFFSFFFTRLPVLRKEQLLRRVWSHRWTLQSQRLESQIIYANGLKTLLSAASRLPTNCQAGILSSSRNGQEAIDETRISPLVLSPARHGARRSCLWTLGRTAAGLPDQCGRRVGARRPEHGRGTRGFHRCREDQILHPEFGQWAELLQQGSAPVSPQLRAIRVRFLFARRGRSFYLEQLPVRGHCYFNNPVDYLSNASDPWFYQQIATCDIHISTGTGPWENSGPTYHLSEVLSSKGIRHSLDNWGPQGGHDWPYWKHQMREYISKLF